MAMIPYPPLPQAQQADPTQRPDIPLLTPEGVTAAQQPMPARMSALPDTTPELIIENDLRSRAAYLDELANDIEKRGLPPEEKQKQLQKLFDVYREMDFEGREKARKIRETRHLVDIGLLDPMEGELSVWRMALPKEVADSLPQLRAEAKPGAPLLPKTLESVRPSMSEFAEAAPSKGQFFTRSKNEPRTQADLLTQYEAWRQFIGYDGRNLTQQKQLDMEWDAVMKARPKWQWDPASEEVSSRRATGALSKAFVGRSGSTPGAWAKANPLASQIRREVDQKLAPKTTPLTKEVAAQLLKEAGGDKNKARQLAKDRGYTL